MREVRGRPMKSARLAILSSVVVTTSLLGALGSGRASPPAPAASASAAAPAKPAGEMDVPSLARIFDGTFRWGMSHANVSEVYNHPGGVIDQDYAPTLSKMQPGTRMEGVVADRENKKRILRTSYVTFDDLPTGFDVSPVKKEYSYLNSESMQWVERQGLRFYFFYFGVQPNEKLWKVYEEFPLKDGATLGSTFAEATAKLGAVLGASGRTRDDDGTAVVEWQDALTHLRAIDRSSTHVIALVFEERSTVSRLGELRKNKLPDAMALDPDVAAAMRNATRPTPAPAPPAPSASTKP